MVWARWWKTPQFSQEIESLFSSHPARSLVTILTELPDLHVGLSMRTIKIQAR
jgi:hypothetical protein